MLLTAFGALGLAVAGVCAAGKPGATGATVPGDLAAWLARQKQWSVSANVDTAVGYKDNLLLSATDGERSAFAHLGAEVLVMRPPGGRFEQSVFLQGEGKRFFSGATVNQQASAWLQSESAWRAGDAWRFSLPVTGYYYNQVFDVSDTDVERLIAEMRLSGAMVGPTVRWGLPSAWWVEVQGLADRKHYDDGVNNSKVGETAVRLGWNPVQSLETRISGTRRWRAFDSRLQYSAAGRPLANTHLRVAETEGEFRANLKWGQDSRWQCQLRAGWLGYRDNGSGYFDHRERKLENEWEWSRGAWLARLSGTARRVDFDVRTVGLGIDPPARLKDEYELAGRLERKLTPRWTLIADFKWERVRSNDPVSSYRVNEGLLGARWSWER